MFGATAQPYREIVMVGDVPVPIDVPAPAPVVVPPISIPSPGPLIQYAGTAEHAAWNDVFSWVKGTSKAFYSALGLGASVVTSDVENIVSAWAGQLLKAVSGFINDLASFAADGLNAAITIGESATGLLLSDVLAIENELAGVLDSVAGIDNLEIPALLGEIARVSGSIEGLVLDGLANVETWAIDNIYDPLQRDIVGTAGDIYDAIGAAVAGAIAHAESLVSAETLARLAAIAGLAATLATVTTWLEECGAPMCETMGPKTDLGKFLKGLAIAGDVALIAELGALDGNGIETLLRGLVSLSHGVIDDLDAMFTGGQTLGGAITHAGG